ncbi:hypothetical protein [Sphingopyxis sp. 113P3]|uniref:hypothetical protein n=1 Tax=Sphingopyxis sp. (strain 113P3) TaxID=292913 RepID=UPI0006AD0EAF|nr:hypothetical protein [Sphingopyxis sp. 113P3]ALC11256.1 hypothetical protein LH20_04745 [Sphingopyxis sp. 113P3]
MTNMYQSSKGPIAIDTMPLSYAKNALAKIQRDETQRHRTAEIGWLDQHIRKLESEAPTDEPNRGIGGNNPPAEAKAAMQWDAIKAHMDDLLTEARNWADGDAISSQGIADEIGRLRQQLQDAAKLADEARVAEKKPLDDEIQKIQDRYNLYIAPLKNKQPGSVSKAVAALGSLLTVWLNKLEAEKQEREKAAREAHEKAQAEAIEARRSAIGTGDLNAIDAADDLLDAAEEAGKALKAVENEKVQAKGEHRAIGLRSRWIARLRDGEGGKALTYYAKTQPDRVKAFLQVLADEDVKAGVRPVNGESPIPGVDIIEERIV